MIEKVFGLRYNILMRYLMIVQYDGKNYNGYQRQKTGNTIQQALEFALEIITHEKVVCSASGRTDAGVSAFLQPVMFETKKEINPQKTLTSLNGILAHDIRVLSLQPTDLHVRFDAKQKTYCYKMYVSNIELPLFSNALKICPNLDFKAMKKFLKIIKGTHDFKGFMASGSEVENTVRTIYSVKLVKDGQYLNFHVTGNGFLYKMVRNIVGTMLKVGEHKISLTDLKSTLFTTFKATHTAKPEFLYLLNVDY